MVLAVAVQSALVGTLALFIGLLLDWSSAKYVALGGAVAVIPNGLLAVRLALRAHAKAGAHPATFFVGELVRVGLTLALLAVVVKADAALRWLPFLLGFMLALKAVYGSMFLMSRGTQGREATEKITGSGIVPGRH